MLRKMDDSSKKGRLQKMVLWYTLMAWRQSTGVEPYGSEQAKLRTNCKDDIRHQWCDDMMMAVATTTPMTIMTTVSCFELCYKLAL